MSGGEATLLKHAPAHHNTNLYGKDWGAELQSWRAGVQHGLEVGSEATAPPPHLDMDGSPAYAVQLDSRNHGRPLSLPAPDVDFALIHLHLIADFCSGDQCKKYVEGAYSIATAMLVQKVGTEICEDAQVQL
ncbi:hypothetical protein AOLI_G00229470 [Acnodon oligacanthus]